MKAMCWRGWFGARGLRTLRYQIKILNEFQSHFSKRKSEPFVLAMGCGGGKTLTTICFLDVEWLKTHPKSRVLVLAHGTSHLRTQFFEVLKSALPSFAYEIAETAEQLRNSTAQVVVTLPQTANKLRRGFPKFSFLVVDEAHHYYFAAMVQRIITKCGATQQLLLTGTPSEFVLQKSRGEKFKIVAVDTLTMRDEGMIQDFRAVVAGCTYKLTDKDYNEAGEILRKRENKLTPAGTKSALDKALYELSVLIRTPLSTAWFAPAKSLAPRVTSWASALKKTGKTMIACNSQRQAKQVAKYFEEQEIGTALSIIDEDRDSGEIERFKNDSKCQILIVVYRGVLGFDYPSLINVIDLTQSRNPDRLFQLMMRVSRVKKGAKKTFIKVVADRLEPWFEDVLTATLCLCHEDYLLTYNKKNFLNLDIPEVERKKPRERNGGDEGESEPEAGGKKKETKKFPDYKGLPVLNFFERVLRKPGGVTPFSWTTLRKVGTELFNWRNSWDFDSLLKDSQKYGSSGEWRKFSPSAYGVAANSGLLPEIRKRNGWADPPKRRDFDSLLKNSQKYGSSGEWRKFSPRAYSAARRNGFLPKICKRNGWPSPRKRNYRSDDSLLEDSQKYGSSGEWAKHSIHYYQAARRRGLLPEIRKRNGWADPPKRRDFDSLLKNSQKYGSSGEWYKHSPLAYNAARKKGFLPKICKENGWSPPRTVASGLVESLK